MEPEWVAAVAEVLAAVAWPLVVLVFLFHHRSSIRSILEGLEAVTLPGGIEGKFRRAVGCEAERLLRENPESPRSITPAQVQAAERVNVLADRSDLTSVRAQVLEAAREYEAIRASMSAGDPRTRRMELVATRLRTMGFAAEPLLPELASSSVPGERLAAISILQVRPRLDYVNWLGERFRTERPFIQYHAAVGLISAARVLGSDAAMPIREAIRTARELLGETNRGTDRWNALDEAERELDR